MKDATLRRELRMIEAAVLAGERAPKNKPLGPLNRDNIAMLAAVGRIRIELFDKNWRVITLLEGPNAGKSTALSPSKRQQPWMIIDNKGKRIFR